MHLIDYIHRYSSANKLPTLNHEQTLRLIKIVEIEARIDQIKKDNGYPRFTTQTTPEIERLKEELFEITKYEPPHLLLKEMGELSK